MTKHVPSTKNDAEGRDKVRHHARKATMVDPRSIFFSEQIIVNGGGVSFIEARMSCQRLGARKATTVVIKTDSDASSSWPVARS